MAVSLCLDTIGALRELDPDSGFFNELVEVYLVDAEVALAAMGELSASQAWAELGRRAHALKGASLNIGALALAETCRKLERANTVGGEDVAEMVARARTEFEEAARALRAELVARAA